MRTTEKLSVTLPKNAPITPKQADYIAALVNSEPVTQYEVLRRLARIEQQLAQQSPRQMPPRDVLERQMLDRLILERLQIQTARTSGIKVDDYAVAQAEKSVASQNGVTVAAMHQDLTQNGIAPARFREELRDQILMTRLREREVDSQVRISDVEAEQYMRDEQNTADPTKIGLNLGHVLVIVPDGASAERVQELRQRAQQAVDAARATGASFADVARQFSDAPEGQNDGGLLGFRVGTDYPAIFFNAVRQQPVGAIVGPIRSPVGFHVLKVVDRVIAGLPNVVPQSHARHILLRITPQLTEADAAARLADYRRRILAGQATFAELAQSYSQDASASQGGDLGWSNPGQYVPEFEQALNALQPGGISEPLISRFGVHLIQLEERRNQPLSETEKREIARAALRDKRLDEAFSLWLQDLRARAYVEYREAP